MKKSIRVPNGKGFLHVDESMQIPTGFDVNKIHRIFIGYYVGSSFRVVRSFDGMFCFDLPNQLLKLQVDYNLPLKAIHCVVEVYEDFNLM